VVDVGISNRTQKISNVLCTHYLFFVLCLMQSLCYWDLSPFFQRSDKGQYRIYAYRRELERRCIHAARKKNKSWSTRRKRVLMNPIAGSDTGETLRRFLATASSNSTDTCIAKVCPSPTFTRQHMNIFIFIYYWCFFFFFFFFS
jgi:hypothetical protein